MIYAPGPYAIKGQSIQAIDHGIRFTIATVKSPKLSPEGVAGTARLMSAAPDLLDALQSVHRELRKSGWDMTRINAALTKAGVSI